MQSNHRVSRLDLKEHGISIATLPEVFYNTNRRLSLVTQVILATLGGPGQGRNAAPSEIQRKYEEPATSYRMLHSWISRISRHIQAKLLSEHNLRASE